MLHVCACMFVALVQELRAEGLVVEAAPRPDGSVGVLAAHATASAAPGQQVTRVAPPPQPTPLVAYHDATKARKMPLASLVVTQ